MIGFELTYYKLLTGEYSGDSYMLKRAFDYWSGQLEIYKELLDELPITDPIRLEIETDYNNINKALAETKRNEKEITVKPLVNNDFTLF